MTTCPVSYDHRSHFNSHADNQTVRAPVALPADPGERDRWLLLTLFRGLDEQAQVCRLGRFV